jgi:3-oxoacyl-[acyl-carrier protein] reductase
MMISSYRRWGILRLAIIGSHSLAPRHWALGPRDITANNVQSGPANTEMNLADGKTAPSSLQHMALERYGHVEEIASFVVYVASPETDYITGGSFLSDGGYLT